MEVRLYCWHIGITIASAINLYTNSTVAQITPDATLPNNSNVIQFVNTFNITGGSTALNNLFHSFKDFSILYGNGAIFNNAVNIQNIIIRVTGNSISNIDGLIKTNGGANLFLINPNGIIFGKNAQLEIGGSFLATSANSIKFGDGFEFSAVNAESTSLLTITAPVGLQFGTNPGAIVVQGNGYNLSTQQLIFSPLIRGSSTNGLQVSPGNTLALVGGNIDLIGGTLYSEQGQIELVAVSNGQVNLTSTPQGFGLNYQEIKNFRDIRLSQQALADASGGGTINVQGNNVSLTDGSLIFGQNQELQKGGSINVNAVQSLKLSGISTNLKFNGGLSTETTGSGSSLDLTVSTKQLEINNGAAIVTRSFGSGHAGNINVNASNSLDLIGFSPSNPYLSSVIASGAFNSGDAGNISVLSNQITALNGGNIGSATLGQGNAGNVIVNSKSIVLIGQSSAYVPSSISVASLGAGDGGQAVINTSSLVARDGGEVNSSAVATGSAGDVTINATDYVEVSGTYPKSLPSSVGSSAPIRDKLFQQTYQLPPVPSGFSGNITVNTSILNIKDDGLVTVKNEGLGRGGTLRINANSIKIDSRGAITGATTSASGGNLELRVRDLLQVRSGSSITTEADGNNSIGGNITIDAGVIGIFDNSNINANSINFQGGKVLINTQAIFGSPDSQITARGLTPQLNGTVQINTPLVNPSKDLVQLPIRFVDASKQISNACTPGNSKFNDTFTVTGRGGLPPHPYEPSRAMSIESAWVKFPVKREETNVRINLSSLITAYPTIIEASGWIADVHGNIELVTRATQTPQILHPLSCSARIYGVKALFDA
ncbi:filamentous hemagglutinin family outer membrane protein [Calothrix sp. PCC 7716]|nr:filamentous hemagglutinin family outer membrane protein [Calothrix sp. PCC 7716]